MDDVTFREATLADAPLIQPLVHHAYRGDRAKVGWTHEADLLDAQRIDEDQLRASSRLCVGDVAATPTLESRCGSLTAEESEAVSYTHLTLPTIA